MSKEDLELARRGHQAFAERGFEGITPYFTEDVVAYPIPEWPDESEYHGHAGLEKLLSAWTDIFDDFRFEAREVLEEGDSLVARGEIVGTTKQSAVPVRQTIGIVYADIRDGRVGEVRYFASWAAALEHVGVREQA